MRRGLALLASTLVVAGCSQQARNDQTPAGANGVASTSTNHPPDTTGWPIFDRNVRQVGMVSTRRSERGILVSLDTRGLPPGVHGVHIHQTAKCEGPTFASAGGHWNWTNKKHGHMNPQGYHSGDLGNLTVDAAGKGQAAFLVLAKDWQPNNAGPLPIIVHAAADDEKTDPSGNSGDRIACGVLYVRPD